MKRRRPFFLWLSLILLLSICPQIANTSRGQMTESTRVVIPLPSNWKFHKGTLELTAAMGAPSGDGMWQSVTIPHTWNAFDGEDGGKQYFRGDGWYRRPLELSPGLRGKRLYLRFQGANRRTEVFVNGRRVGAHTGGTQTFVVDITSAVIDGDNELVVHVDNKPDQDSPPLQADFTFFGGIYRPVELIAVNPLHISLMDLGSPGVYISTQDVSENSANVHVRTLVEKPASPATVSAQITVQICDATGRTVVEKVTPLSPEVGGLSEVSTDLVVPTPHLWNGVYDPYLYTVKVTLQDASMPGGNLFDAITQPLGIRTFAVDLEKGFVLNGKPYPLHGVCRHQDRQDEGWAISEEDQLQDMGIIKEMGCTGIRLPHYQQSDFFYRLCDKEGLVVWAEIPVVDKLGSSKAFTANAQQQYSELIHQNFNHPSIAFWSSGNEVDESGGNFNRSGPQVYPWFKQMGILGHHEDPARLTAASYRERFFPPPDTTEVFGLNIYLGWYNNTFDDIDEYIAKHDANGARGKWAVTEYGAGGSIYFHSETPVRMDHTEEYQSLYHEHNWAVLKKHSEIWGKFVWSMFDFASDGRAEGDHAGINDKGLVTYDRKIKKDAFYFYKASWSSEPTLYITSRRFSVRGLARIPVKIYSNAPSVILQVNGKFVSERTSDNAVFTWDDVELKEGRNGVRVSAKFPDGRVLTDEAVFTYSRGAPEEIYEAQDDIMRKKYKDHPPQDDLLKKPVAVESAIKQ